MKKNKWQSLFESKKNIQIIALIKHFALKKHFRPWILTSSNFVLLTRFLINQTLWKMTYFWRGNPCVTVAKSQTNGAVNKNGNQVCCLQLMLHVKLSFFPRFHTLSIKLSLPAWVGEHHRLTLNKIPTYLACDVSSQGIIGRLGPRQRLSHLLMFLHRRSPKTVSGRLIPPPSGE